eukprot:201657_1
MQVIDHIDALDEHQALYPLASHTSRNRCDSASYVAAIELKVWYRIQSTHTSKPPDVDPTGPRCDDPYFAINWFNSRCLRCNFSIFCGSLLILCAVKSNCENEDEIDERRRRLLWLV